LTANHTKQYAIAPSEMTIAGIVGSRTPLSDDAIIIDMEAPKDRIERALCLFVFTFCSLP
jgi:hypothetical protein